MDNSSTSQRTARTWSSVRWWICGLLFLATTINYLDRQTLSVLKPILQKDLHWGEADYGWINFAFQSAYALMFTFAGRLVDLIGVKMGFVLGIVVWSLAAMAHAAARSTFGFAVARFLLGAGESVNFPASLKAIAEWFPQKERALAAGVFNSGSNVGIIFGFLAVSIAQNFHWQMAFLVTGALGFLWLLLWLKFYHSPSTHPAVSPAELAYIQEGQPAGERPELIRWTALLRYRQAWAFLIGKFLTDPVWWFYLYWLPSYLNKERHLTALASATWLIIPYVAADVGSIGGGWLSDSLMKRGWSAGKARYAAMGLCALCMPGALVAVRTDNFALALALISLATTAHQGWSANIFTTATDMFPSRVAGSVVGLGGACGAIGGMLMALLVGGALQWLHSYLLVFIWAGLMHPLSWILFWFIAGPEMSRASIRSDADQQSDLLLIWGGIIVAIVGGLGTAFTLLNWNSLVEAAKQSGAAAGVGAAIGVALLGLVVLYAGLGHRRAS